MTTYVKVHGKTEEEAKQKARDLMKKTDPMQQPEMYSPTQNPDGTWSVTVLIRGLD